MKFPTIEIPTTLPSSFNWIMEHLTENGELPYGYAFGHRSYNIIRIICPDGHLCFFHRVRKGRRFIWTCFKRQILKRLPIDLMTRYTDAT